MENEWMERITDEEAFDRIIDKRTLLVQQGRT